MIKLNSMISENVSGKSFISVDIQPEYQQSFGFTIEKYCEFLNSSYDQMSSLTFLYNGSDTLGMINENDYKMWFLENGCNEEVIDGAQFYDKGYAFFRYCMDSNLDDDVIVNFVRFMYLNDIRDSREMDRDMWAKYLRQHRKTDKKQAYDLLSVSNDCVHIPDLMDYLKRFGGNIVLTGGGVNECLKEVEIALKALNKTYTIYKPFTY